MTSTTSYISIDDREHPMRQVRGEGPESRRHLSHVLNEIHSLPKLTPRSTPEEADRIYTAMDTLIQFMFPTISSEILAALSRQQKGQILTVIFDATKAVLPLGGIQPSLHA